MDKKEFRRFWEKLIELYQKRDLPPISSVTEKQAKTEMPVDICTRVECLATGIEGTIIGFAPKERGGTIYDIDLVVEWDEPLLGQFKITEVHPTEIEVIASFTKSRIKSGEIESSKKFTPELEQKLLESTGYLDKFLDLKKDFDFEREVDLWVKIFHDGEVAEVIDPETKTIQKVPFTDIIDEVKNFIRTHSRHVSVPQTSVEKVPVHSSLIIQAEETITEIEEKIHMLTDKLKEIDDECAKYHEAQNWVLWRACIDEKDKLAEELDSLVKQLSIMKKTAGKTQKEPFKVFDKVQLASNKKLEGYIIHINDDKPGDVDYIVYWDQPVAGKLITEVHPTEITKIGEASEEEIKILQVERDKFLKQKEMYEEQFDQKIKEIKSSKKTWLRKADPIVMFEPTINVEVKDNTVLENVQVTDEGTIKTRELPELPDGGTLQLQKPQEDTQVEKLQEELYTDVLTGLYNRRFLQDKQQDLQNQYKFLAVVDIDHFKEVNDKKGHDVGDQVLKKFADILRSIPNILPIRWGGEEFVVFMNNLHDSETIRQTIEEKTKDDQVPITVSVGVAPTKEDTFEITFENADKALRHSKESGRNQVTVYEDGLKGLEGWHTIKGQASVDPIFKYDLDPDFVDQLQRLPKSGMGYHVVEVVYDGSKMDGVIYNDECLAVPTPICLDKADIYLSANKIDPFIQKVSYFPDHPDKPKFGPNEFYKEALKEKDIYNYWKSVENKLLPILKDFNIMTMIKVDDKIVYKRNDDKGNPLRVTTSEDYEKWIATGGTLSVHLIYPNLTKIAHVELDAHEKVPFEKVKEITKDLYKCLEDIEQVKDISIRYSGSRGFYLILELQKPVDVNEFRKVLKDTLDTYISEKKDPKLTTGITKDPEGIRLDVSTLKTLGSLRAPYSLNEKTGLVSVPLELTELDSFKKEDAKIPLKPRFLKSTIQKYVEYLKQVSAQGIAGFWREIYGISQGAESDFQDVLEDHGIIKFAQRLPVLEPGYKGKFVIHKHETIKKPGHPHFDLRLEWDVTEDSDILKPYKEKRKGPTPEPKPKEEEPKKVLRSWAIPKAHLPVYGEKMLAIEVEPHDYDYISFEGTIPAGSYGAGVVSIYDSGKWELIDADENKITFNLEGDKIKGTFTLVRTKGKSWLFIKSKTTEE